MTPKVLPEALIEELLAAAGKATPGPWDTDEPHIVYAGNGEELGDNVRYLANTKDLDTDYKEAKANAGFIALANPQTISALIAEVKAARASRVLQDASEAFVPESEAAYLASIWKLSNAQISKLEDAFRRAMCANDLGGHPSPEASGVTNPEHLAHTGQTTPLADREKSAALASRVLQDEGVVAVRSVQAALHLLKHIDDEIARVPDKPDPVVRNNLGYYAMKLREALSAILPSTIGGSVGVSEERPAVYIGANDVTAYVTDDMVDVVRAAFDALPRPDFGEPVLPLYLRPAALSPAISGEPTGPEQEPDACPICAVAFKPDDLCQTDIELGTCHAACLKGSPLVDLETGDQLPEGSEWPEPYRYASIQAQER